ncbi:MAG TPA: HlyD family efflux transporter periplasmic adaptor subunit [Terriglobia bacterium]|nr:HlyD family efflux transporter periplasmic adaptor subunit [Terriglobia bacterium]
MDVPRPQALRQKRIRQAAYLAIAIVAVTATTIALSKLKAAAPTVEFGTLWPDTVKRGTMLREVHGLGTLVPVEIRWIPAATDGRIDKLVVLPGSKPVKADTILVEMSNPELQQSAVDAEYQMKAAQADYNSLKVKLETTLLDQKSVAATVGADYRQAKLQAEVDSKLAENGLISNLTVQLDNVKADSLNTRNGIEQTRLSTDAASEQAQLDAQQAKIDQLRALYELKKSQVELLHVRAGIDGVLQLLPVEVGQRVTAGTNIARVSQPTKLKAEVKIAETQVKDVVEGQKASIDTHNGIIPGHVIRKDPSSVNGTVSVDVALDGPLPQGAYPDLSVDGTIELEKLNDVLYVGRPTFGQPDSTVMLFKVTNHEKEAIKVPVKLGRSSVSTIEIISGLSVGDEVILSDMSRYDNVDRIELSH